jgi:protein MpaA
VKTSWKFIAACIVAACLAATLVPAHALPLSAAQEAKPSGTADNAKSKVPRYVEIGHSVRGRSIMATIYGTGKIRVIVVGGIHGDEPSSSILAKALAATIGRDGLAGNLSLIIVPDANPDGLVANTRVNANGVDINRNFPSASWKADYPDARHYPGTAPATEPETRALMKLIEDYPPNLLITLHGYLGCMNWDGPGEEIARSMASINKYPLCSYLGYDTPGSLGHYVGLDRKIRTVTIELKGGNAGDRVSENLPALRTAYIYLAFAKTLDSKY